MLKVRKQIRKILNEMGFNNGFLLKHEPAEGNVGGTTMHIVIKDWEPDSRALALKRELEKGLAEKVVISFTGPGIVCKTVGEGEDEDVVCNPS